MAVIERNDLDQQIWDEELADFVPEKVFDAHTHIYRWVDNIDPDKQNGPFSTFVRPEFEHAGWDLLDECDQILMPGRSVQRLSFPFPFPQCDFAGSNDFITGEVSPHPESGALTLVHPSMTADEVDATVRAGGFLGLKPYRFYSSTGDPVECRITDFMAEHQIAVADQHGLIIMMHLSRSRGISDEQNLDDLEWLTTKYPRVRWILAHCARSYSSWPIEKAGNRLRDLPNIWCDTSSVCESDAVEALLRTIGVDRVMYGSDDVPVGVLRGKYVAFGFGWAYLSEENQSLNLSHCDPRMTFTRYEGLRAMKRAARSVGLTGDEVQAMFHDNAVSLIEQVRSQ